MTVTKKSLAQVLTIACALSKTENVGTNEIMWFRNELKRWFNSLM